MILLVRGRVKIWTQQSGFRPCVLSHNSVYSYFNLLSPVQFHAACLKQIPCVIVECWTGFQEIWALFLTLLQVSSVGLKFTHMSKTQKSPWRCLKCSFPGPTLRDSDLAVLRFSGICLMWVTIVFLMRNFVLWETLYQ